MISNCPYPSFNPLNYVPDQLTITEEMPNLANESEMPTSEPPKTETTTNEKKKKSTNPALQRTHHLGKEITEMIKN